MNSRRTEIILSACMCFVSDVFRDIWNMGLLVEERDQISTEKSLTVLLFKIQQVFTGSRAVAEGIPGLLNWLVFGKNTMAWDD